MRADDLGTWKCTGSRQLQFMVRITKTECLIVNDILSADAQVVHVRRIPILDHDCTCSSIGTSSPCMVVYTVQLFCLTLCLW